MPMSPPPHNSAQELPSSEFAGRGYSNPEYSSEERALLLRLAHQSIESGLRQLELPLDPPTAHLSAPRGVFTSLHKQGELRGCVGCVSPTYPVYRTVAETARAAAFEDNRFPPVTEDETPRLEVELSILSPPAEIHPEAIEIGRHGLVISWHGRRGLLLPQVAVEHKWDRIAFLEQTCRKAGLPLDAWRRATVQAFTAEVFREKSTR
jgi:AmmeMemoRadiSam system protein A